MSQHLCVRLWRGAANKIEASRKTAKNCFSIFHTDTRIHACAYTTHTHTYIVDKKQYQMRIGCFELFPCLCGSFFFQLLRFVFVYQFISLASVFLFFSSIQLLDRSREKKFPLRFTFLVVRRIEGEGGFSRMRVDKCSKHTYDKLNGGSIQQARCGLNGVRHFSGARAHESIGRQN